MNDGEKSLEDFFAKKSKKKGGKGKGKKFTTSDEIAKKLVDQPPQDHHQVPEKTESTTKKSKELSKDENEEENVDYRFKDDDEWTDFRDEFQKDYSGLKVQALQITEEQPDGTEEEEVDENGEPIKNKGQGQTGPWNKQQESGSEAGQGQAQAPTPAPPKPAPEPEPPKEESKPAATAGKYVPPSKRGAAAASATSASGGPARLGMVRKGKTPQINSEFEFPSLAASSDLVKHSNKVEDATFSTVTKGGQQVDGMAAKGGDLALGNRYAALEN